MPRRLPFALYDAFPAGPFGGATAGIVSDAAELSSATMQRIAKEVAAPATAFVQRVDDDHIDVRFFSTLTEFGMCGHGTVALVTHLVESGQLSLRESNGTTVTLRTCGGDAPVTVRQIDGQPLVMLDLRPSSFDVPDIDVGELAGILGISSVDIEGDLPIEKATGDFVHLIVPIPSLRTMQKITPDFGAIAAFSRASDIQTVTVFTREVHHSDSTVHCRDFCPAVGTPESPAAGTTNGALTSYFVRHGLIALEPDGTAVVLSEQGYECDRPSLIRSEVSGSGKRIEHLAVGGHATKSIAGDLFVHDDAF